MTYWLKTVDDHARLRKNQDRLQNLDKQAILDMMNLLITDLTKRISETQDSLIRMERFPFEDSGTNTDITEKKKQLLIKYQKLFNYSNAIARLLYFDSGELAEAILDWADRLEVR